MSESRCPICQTELDGTGCPGCGWQATGDENQQTAIQVRPITYSESPTKVQVPERPSLIGDRYQLQDMIGRGAFGEVYRALDNKLNRIVAVKILRPERLGADPRSYLLRFQAEARTVAALDHPNIVPIYDTGEQDGLPWMVLQYVEGQTLRQLLEQEKSLPPDQAESIIVQLRRALYYAHGQKVVHRDVKPSNVLILPDGTVKLMDFGVAKSASSNLQTAEGIMIGTLNYMSPEQIKGKNLSGASDMFSLGCIWYELLTGKKAFDGPDATSVIYKIIHEEPAWPELDQDPSLDPAREVLIKLLSKDPGLRKDALADTSPPTLNAHLSSSQGARLASPSNSLEAAPRSKAGLYGFLGLAAVALVTFFVWWITRQEPAFQPEQPGEDANQVVSQESTLSPERTVFRIGVASFKGQTTAEQKVGADLPGVLQLEVDKRLLDQRGPALDLDWVSLGQIDNSKTARKVIDKQDLDLILWGITEAGTDGPLFRPQFEHRYSNSLYFVRRGLTDNSFSFKFSGSFGSTSGLPREATTLPATVDHLLLQVASGVLYHDWKTTVAFETHGALTTRILRGVIQETPSKLLMLADAVDDPNLQQSYLSQAAVHPEAESILTRVALIGNHWDAKKRLDLFRPNLEEAMQGYSIGSPAQAEFVEGLVAEHLIQSKTEPAWCVHAPFCEQVQSSSLEQALKLMNTTITNDPDNGRWYWLRSRIHQLSGHADQWRADIRKAIELGEVEGPLGDLYVAYMEVIASLEEKDTAPLNCEWATRYLEDIRIASGFHPWADLLYFRIRDRCLKENPKRLEIAQQEAIGLFEEHPKSSALAWLISNYYLEMEQPDQELTWLKKAEALPDSRWRNLMAEMERGFETTVYSGIADHYDLKEDYEQALPYMHRAAQYAPDKDYLFQFLYAVQLESVEQPELALKAYRRFASVHEQSMWGFIFNGWMQDAWIEMSQWAREAEETATRHQVPEIERSPIPTMVLLSAYRAQGRMQEAEQEAQKVIGRMPHVKNIAAVQRAGWYLAMEREEKQDPETALIMYQLVGLIRDLESDNRDLVVPDAVYIRIHHGVLLRRQGQEKKALAEFRRALAMTALNPWPISELGEDRWPRPIIHYLLRDIEAAALIEQAITIEEFSAGRELEAEYYLAVDQLDGGAVDQAQARLLECYLSQTFSAYDWTDTYADIILIELDPTMAHHQLYEEIED